MPSRVFDPALLAKPAAVPTQSLLPLGTLAGFLIFAALAFGAVHAWAYSLLQLLFLGLGFFFIGWQFFQLKSSTQGCQVEWISFPLTPWLLFLVVWIAIQLVPLPAGVVAWLSPQAAAIRELGTVEAPSWYSLSLNPFATKLELFRLLLAIMVIYLTLWAVKSSKGLVMVILTIIGLGLFETLYGASQLFSKPVRIWGWKTVSVGTRLSGTFINPDHMATFLEVAFFLTIGLFFGLKPKKKGNPGNQRQGWQGFKKLLLEPQLVDNGTKRIGIFFLSLVLATGLFLTQSRGGVCAALVALTTILFMERSRQKGKFPWAPIGVFLGSLALYLWLVAGDIDLSRFGSTFDLEEHKGRFSMYWGTLALAKEFPVFGVGWGAFADIFSKYQLDPLFDKFVDLPHSDWLQLLGETGIIGFSLVALGAGSYFLYLWKFLQKRRDRFMVGISLGCLASLFSVGFHAAVDFPLHIPANAMIIGVVSALAFLAVHLHRHPREHFSYPVRRVCCRRHWTLVCLGALAGLVFLLAVPIWKHWAAERLVPSELDFTRQRQDYTVAKIKKAMNYNSNNPAYPALLAAELHKNQIESETGERENNTETEVIIDLFRQSIRLNPAQWRQRIKFGWLLMGSGSPEKVPQVQQGLKELEACTKLFPASGMLHFNYGSALLLVENAFPDFLPPEKKGLWAQEIEMGIKQDPDLAEKAERLLDKMDNP